MKSISLPGECSPLPLEGGGGSEFDDFLGMKIATSEIGMGGITSEL